MDASAAWNGRPAVELLDEFLQPFHTENPPDDITHLIAINDGPLSAWLDEQKQESHLTQQIELALGLRDDVDRDPRLLFVDLNTRSLVGSIDRELGAIKTEFLEHLLKNMVADDGSRWTPCETCTAKERCQAWNSVKTLRDPSLGPLVRRRLARLLQAVHHRGEIHITARSLRSALIFGFFGTSECEDLHRNIAFEPRLYYDHFFEHSLENRQGDLLAELQSLDPALGSHPNVDRALLLEESPRQEEPRLHLRSMRRRCYFEWSEEQLNSYRATLDAVGLHKCCHLGDFASVWSLDEEMNRKLCASLCQGIARLEDLPEKAFNDSSLVPLKIAQRTPTETAFWVSKSLGKFELRVRLPNKENFVEILHTQLELTYSMSSGHLEKLSIGAELFELLMNISEGLQISDTLSDDVFANLAIFKQRLAQEDDRVLFAWSPVTQSVYRVSVALDDAGKRYFSKRWPIMSKKIVEEVLTARSTKAIWSASYKEALPIVPQDFSMGAVLLW